MNTNNPLPRKQLGKYDILEILGQGGMGTVYKARDRKLDRLVALKTIRDDLLTSAENDLLKRLEREAKAAARLSHPNIVTVFDFDSAEGISFIAFEFVEGQEFKQHIANRLPLPADEALHYILQVLSGLAHAHARGVVHRDMKPANIMRLVDGTVKIADFGIARVDLTHLTQSGAFVGTPQYMSPEQVVGDTIDGRSDLFSVAVMLYELLTATPPFRGDSVTAVIYQVLNKIPPLLSDGSFKHLKPFDQVIERALAKNPEDRYPSAEQLSAALTQAHAGGTLSIASPLPCNLTAEDLKHAEAELARYIGPIAKVLVGKAARTASSFTDLTALVSLHVPQPDERDKFMASFTKRPSVALPLTTRAQPLRAWDAKQLQIVQDQLAHFIGPLAAHLVKKVSLVAASEKELYELLAKYIRHNDDRAKFLTMLKKE